MVVSIDDLTCLDALIWLSRGDVAAEKINASQSSISRVARRVAEDFGVELIKGEQEWHLLGDTRYLDLERALHQRMRWDCSGALRLEAQYYSGPLRTKELGPEFLLGNFDFLDVNRPVDLMHRGVLDVWLAGYPDVPEPNDPELQCFDLTRMPLKLVVSNNHPLIELGDAVRLSDVSDYPCLALQDGAFPKVQRKLEDLGLWNSPARIRRYKPEKWLGRTSDQVTVGCASAFSIALFPEAMVCLPIELDFTVGECLVVKREYANHLRFKQFLELMQERSIDLAASFDDVSVAF